MKNIWSEAYKEKVIHPKDLVQKRDSITKTVVTINGTFDLLHAGHIHILYEASQQGDILIVAANSDQSIKTLKGESRPINSLPYRLQHLAAFSFVDYVTWFEETTPLNILKKLRPNIHVNGIEYGENCIEAELVKSIGGKIYLVDRIDNLSSTKILEQCAY